MRSAMWGSLLAWVLWLLSTPVPGNTNEALYEQLITTTAHEHGIDPALVKAVIKCESGFNPRAQSPRGAQGLMQLIPSTQTMLGVSDPFDPAHNLTAGARYLAMLMQMFSGDLRLALAGYNAGPQRVVEAGYTIPAIAETQQYVRCVTAAYERYHQPGAAAEAPGYQDVPEPDADRRPLIPMPATPGKSRRVLAVSPLRLSSHLARLGQRLTIHVEAVNAGPRPAHGVVMLHYPEHLVSFIALHTTGPESPAQFPAPRPGASAATLAATPAYQILWSHWPSWAPGERRTAVIALVPRVPQDIVLQVSVGIEEATAVTASQQWSTTVRIPRS